MPSWKSKICRGMDVVETITFTRQDIDVDGKSYTVSAVYVPGESDQRPRDQWTQAEIDAIGEGLVANLDANLAQAKNRKIELP
jgi:hypothetical protein